MLPTLLAHRAQDQFARLTQSCNCTVGEALGGATFLLGTCLACILQSWRSLSLAVIASITALLVGKFAEVAWNRVQILLVLGRLRRQLSVAVTGHPVESPAPMISKTQTYDYPLNSRNGDESHPEQFRQRRPPGGRERPKVILRNGVDIDRAIRLVWGSWRVPRMVVQLDDIPTVSLERIQDRLVRLSGGYDYQLAGVLAFVAFVAGMTLVMRPPDDVLQWTLQPDWVDFLMVLIATLHAGLLGIAGEVLWIRWRLLRVLRDLRRQLAES